VSSASETIRLIGAHMAANRYRVLTAAVTGGWTPRLCCIGEISGWCRNGQDEK
jgi:hypothetical protein